MYYFIVIIPTYNRKHQILDTISSVLNQKLQDREILVVDDRSTDETVEVVKEYQNNHPNIRYYFEP